MKISISILFLLLTVSFTHAQSYEKSMEQAFELWDENKNEQAIALFQRISHAETEKWLPAYYAANVDIVQAFNKSQSENIQAYLERAKENLSLAKDRSPDNSEITTLEGLLYTGYVTADPATYGMRYSGKIITLHEKAIEQNPENPRAHMNLIEYEMGYAQFMGEDMTMQCDLMKKVLPLFDKVEDTEPFAPKYGKERALQIVKNCNESK